MEQKNIIYVKKLDVLVSSKRRDEDGKHISKQAYPCPNCLHSFSSQFLLIKHREGGCDLFEPTKTLLPFFLKKLRLRQKKEKMSCCMKILLLDSNITQENLKHLS